MLIKHMETNMYSAIPLGWDAPFQLTTKCGSVRVFEAQPGESFVFSGPIMIDPNPEQTLKNRMEMERVTLAGILLFRG